MDKTWPCFQFLNWNLLAVNEGNGGSWNLTHTKGLSVSGLCWIQTGKHRGKKPHTLQPVQKGKQQDPCVGLDLSTFDSIRAYGPKKVSDQEQAQKAGYKPGLHCSNANKGLNSEKGMLKTKAELISLQTMELNWVFNISGFLPPFPPIDVAFGIKPFPGFFKGVCW